MNKNTINTHQAPEKNQENTQETYIHQLLQIHENASIEEIDQALAQSLQETQRSMNIMQRNGSTHIKYLRLNFGESFLGIAENAHRLWVDTSDIISQFPQTIKFVKNFQKQYSSVYSFHCYQHIEDCLEAVRTDPGELTRSEEELQNILQKVTTFLNAEIETNKQSLLMNRAFAAHSAEASNIILNDTEGKSIRTYLIEFRENFETLSEKERKIFTLLLLVYAEYLRKEILAKLEIIKPTSKQENTNVQNISENKFFRLSEHISDFEEIIETEGDALTQTIIFRTTIDTENLIENVRATIAEILGAENIENIRKMDPIENFAEEDFKKIVQEVTAQVMYIFKYGQKKERKELAKIINNLEKSENVAEHELGGYLNEISEDGKRKTPEREIFAKK